MDCALKKNVYMKATDPAFISIIHIVVIMQQIKTILPYILMSYKN